MAEGIGTTHVTQIAIVVRDIERVRRAYSEVFGIEEPPIMVTAERERAQTEHRGAPSEARAKLCFFHFGQVQIELIEPDEDPNSTWREHLEENGESVHHIALQVAGMPDRIAHLDASGMPLVQKGEYEGGRYAYVDSVPKLGVMLELLENDR